MDSAVTALEQSMREKDLKLEQIQRRIDNLLTQKESEVESNLVAKEGQGANNEGEQIPAAIPSETIATAQAIKEDFKNIVRDFAELKKYQQEQMPIIKKTVEEAMEQLKAVEKMVPQDQE